MKYDIGLFYAICGLVHLYFSGSAEGFFSPRSPIIFVFIIAIFHAVRMLFAFLQKKSQPKMAFNFLGIFVLVGGIFGGLAIDTIKTAETQKIGDQIIEKIVIYHQRNGSYPSTLSQITVTQRPTLKNSNFYYSLDKEDGFTLGFDTFAFMQCERSPHSEWVCDD